MRIKVGIKVKWWVVPYLKTLALWCKTFNCEPDYKKVEKIVVKGIKLGRIEHE